MNDKFIIKPKNIEKKEDKSVIMTLRLNKNLQREFDKLSIQSGRSRNELMCMALQYALEHLEYISVSNEVINNINSDYNENNKKDSF